MSTTDTTKTSDENTRLSAIIIAEMVLGKIRLPDQIAEPDYLPTFRRVVNPIRKAIGAQQMVGYVEFFKPAHHAFAALLADKIVGHQHPETIKQLKSLPIPLRTMVELAVRNMTGGQNGSDRWPPALWKAKEVIASVVDLSPSDLTAEDIRMGYDEILHLVVDAIYERWESVIS